MSEPIFEDIASLGVSFSLELKHSSDLGGQPINPSFLYWSVFLMVLMLDGYSEHVAHAFRKTCLFGEKKYDL